MRVPLGGRPGVPTVVLALAAVACGSRAGLTEVGGVGSIASSSQDGGNPPSDAGAAQDSTYDAAPQGEFHALAVTDCGPADGAAKTFIVSPSPLQCPDPSCAATGCVPPRPGTRDEVTIYGLSSSSLGASISFQVTGPNGKGQAVSCRNGTCVAATFVMATFLESLPAGTLTGTYTLTLSDGSVVSGSLNGVVCSYQPRCG